MSELINALPVIISLVIMEGLLSVDNAMVIAAMVSHLPEKQRTWALRAGLAGAYIFRGLTLAFVTFIIANPWIKLLGAGYLVYLMFKNLGIDDEKPAHGSITGSRSFWGTVIGVELADLAFSIDNVIAAVALSPKLWIVITGVFIGILAMRFVAGVFVKLMEKYPILESIAYILVGYVGIQLFAEELWHVHVTELGKLAAIMSIIASGLIYSKTAWLQAVLGPIINIIAKAMGLVARLIGLILSPLTGLGQWVFSLFRKNE
jgi:tellurite resistance protein TerC